MNPVAMTIHNPRKEYWRSRGSNRGPRPVLKSATLPTDLWGSVIIRLGFVFTNKTEPFTTQSILLTTLRKKPSENIVGKGENAGKQHFLLFPQCFLLFTKQISNLQSLLFCCLQILSIWTSLKYCRLVMS